MVVFGMYVSRWFVPLIKQRKRLSFTPTRPGPQVVR